MAGLTRVVPRGQQRRLVGRSSDQLDRRWYSGAVHVPRHHCGGLPRHVEYRLKRPVRPNVNGAIAPRRVRADMGWTRCGRGGETTSTSSKIAFTRAVSRPHDSHGGILRSETQPTARAKVRVRPSRRSGCGRVADVVVHAAEVAGRASRSLRAGRIVQVSLDHLVTEFTQQRNSLCHRGPLRVTDTRRHPRRTLGAKRDPQPDRRPCCGCDEPTVRPGCCRRHVEEECSVFNGSCDRTVHSQSLPSPIVRAKRHPTTLRLDPVEPAPCRGSAYRPATVGAEASGQARGHAAAVPPLLPPGDRARSHGLRVTPNAVDSVNGQIVISGTFVFPSTIAPRLATAPRHRHRGADWSVGCGSARSQFTSNVNVILDRNRNAEKRKTLARVEPGLAAAASCAPSRRARCGTHVLPSIRAMRSR